MWTVYRRTETDRWSPDKANLSFQLSWAEIIKVGLLKKTVELKHLLVVLVVKWRVLKYNCFFFSKKKYTLLISYLEYNKHFWYKINNQIKKISYIIYTYLCTLYSFVLLILNVVNNCISTRNILKFAYSCFLIYRNPRKNTKRKLCTNCLPWEESWACTCELWPNSKCNVWAWRYMIFFYLL